MSDALKLSWKLPREILWGLGLALVILVGYLDWVAGNEIYLSFLYLFPIGLVTWFGGRSYGLGLSVAAAITKIVADLNGAAYFTNPLVVYWNATVALGAFGVAVYFLSGLRGTSEQLEKRVKQQTVALREEIEVRRHAETAIRRLAAQLSAAEEAERGRLAADLHDSIGQGLSLLKLNLEVSTGEPDENHTDHPAIAPVLQQIDDIITQIRTVTFNLHPAMLEYLGLVPTLESYAEQFSAQTKCKTTITQTGCPQPLSPALAGYLFRAVKELLTNAAKHGRAREVYVAVYWREGGIRMVIDDDGCGFDSGKTQTFSGNGGLGLAGIRERITAFGGWMVIESETGKGTRVILEIPLERQP